MLGGSKSDFEIIVASHVASGWTLPARPHPQPCAVQREPCCPHAERRKAWGALE